MIAVPHRKIKRGRSGRDVRGAAKAADKFAKDHPALHLATGAGLDGVADKGAVQAIAEAAFLLGVGSSEFGPVSVYAQTLLRSPGLRNKTQRKRAVSRQAARRKQANGGAGKPKEDFTRIVRNQSKRTDSIKLIVLHDTEGANVKGISDLVGLGGWFDNPAAQASAHIAVDAEGNTGRYVADESKAWHCAAFNSMSLGIEQVGFASQQSWPDAQIEKVAHWVAYWSKKYGIPLTHSTSHGVCMHSDLGTAGGGHHDPGAGYPFARVLKLAAGFAQ